MRSLGSAGNRAACGSHVTLSGFWLPFTAQQKEMSFATTETGDSPSLLCWHQVSLLWCPDRVGAAPMLGIPCSFQRPGYCCFVLLELDFLTFYFLTHFLNVSHVVCIGLWLALAHICIQSPMGFYYTGRC